MPGPGGRQPDPSARTWLVGNTAQDCKNPDTEYMEFRKNGTFETGRGGKAENIKPWSQCF
jgi:hypothetical protein